MRWGWMRVRAAQSAAPLIRRDEMLRGALNPSGICVMVGDRSGRGMVGILTRLIVALVLSWFVSQKFVTFLGRPSKDDLTIMRDLMKAGKVTPVIDKRYRSSDDHFSSCLGITKHIAQRAGKRR